MKKHILTSLALIATLIASAQVESDWSKKVKDMQESSRKSFEEYRQQVLNDYESFRQEINAEYARFMAEAWQHFDSNPAEEIPWTPKPPQPVVVDPQTRPTADPIPYDLAPIAPKPIDNPKPDYEPKPIDPVIYTPKPAETTVNIRFYGTDMKFHIDRSNHIFLASINEKDVAQLWTQFSDASYDNLLADCLTNREQFNLSDWAYIMLTEQVAENLCGGHSNEAVVLHAFLLTNSGYQVRLACADRKYLCVLVATMDTIYHHVYFDIQGTHYYCFDNSLDDMSFNIFNRAFPQEKMMTVAMSQPKLAVSLTEPRTITSKRFPSVSIAVQTNKNLIDFYNSCPLNSQWNWYSAASLSSTIKESLYPALRKAIEGKSQSEAANMLINFVQTGFEYATDQQQFGYERPLYPDESFYYPFCDCEDRSILYSCLVRELLGLDVVLLNYPDHLATAVCFTDPVAGDYLEIDGERYVICDPTYIGASIGMCMPNYKSVRPIIQLF